MKCLHLKTPRTWKLRVATARVGMWTWLTHTHTQHSTAPRKAWKLFFLCSGQERFSAQLMITSDVVKGELGSTGSGVTVNCGLSKLKPSEASCMGLWNAPRIIVHGIFYMRLHFTWRQIDHFPGLVSYNSVLWCSMQHAQSGYFKHAASACFSAPRTCWAIFVKLLQTIQELLQIFSPVVAHEPQENCVSKTNTAPAMIQNNSVIRGTSWSSTSWVISVPSSSCSALWSRVAPSTHGCGKSSSWRLGCSSCSNSQPELKNTRNIRMLGYLDKIRAKAQPNTQKITYKLIAPGRVQQLLQLLLIQLKRLQTIALLTCFSWRFSHNISTSPEKDGKRHLCWADGGCCSRLDIFGRSWAAA